MPVSCRDSESDKGQAAKPFALRHQVSCLPKNVRSDCRARADDAVCRERVRDTNHGPPLQALTQTRAEASTKMPAPTRSAAIYQRPQFGQERCSFGNLVLWFFRADMPLG